MTTATDIDNALEARAQKEWDAEVADARNRVLQVFSETIVSNVDKTTRDQIIDDIRTAVAATKSAWIDRRKAELLDRLLSRIRGE